MPLVCIASIFSSNVVAVTPSPQMIEQFKKLPKSEQERMARQYGIDPSSFSTSSQSQSIDNPEVVVPLEEQLEQKKEAEERQLIVDEVSNYLKDRQDITKQELKPFGYELFEGMPTTFAPVSDAPVPNNYLIGPGDVFNVQLFGKDANQFELVVGRDGNVQFPDLGPITVSGMSFTEAKTFLETAVKEQIIGVRTNISLGQLRSIRVFVAGEAFKPGAYTVSSLSSITQALYVSGGVREIGSLRNIQLKRNGKLITTLDLYDLLMRGDSSGDQRLMSGDVVFIPPVQSTVSIDGEVRRPAIYEISASETLMDVIDMAGGIRASAYAEMSSVERYSQGGLKTIENVDLTSQKGKTFKVRKGDHVRVKTASKQFSDSVTVLGAVVRPGMYQAQVGSRISDIIPSVWGGLSVTADLGYGIVIREVNKFGDIEIHQFSPKKAIVEKAEDDIAIQARDIIMFFNHSDDIQDRFALNELLKKRIETVVSLTGGETSRSQDLFKAGFADLQSQKLRKRSDLGGVVIAKEQTQDDDSIAIKGEVNRMMANLFDDPELIKLSPLMNRAELLYPVILKLSQQSQVGSEVSVVAVRGQVFHQGVYPLAVNAHVADLIIAAGGLKEGAYTARAELTRTSLEEESSVISHKHIDLIDALRGARNENAKLRGRDILTVMTTPDWQENKSVEIRGEVRFPGVYNIRRGETLNDVLQRAGGFTDYAYPPSAVFVRESIRQQEQLEIKKLADQLRRDIATRGVSKDGDVVNYSDARMMLTDLETIEAVGRLVVDLSAISMGVKDADLMLEDSDVLYVPSNRQTISVMGEVQHAATHRYKAGLTLDQYLQMSGGVRERADDGRTYIVKANGAVVLPTRSMWFSSDTQLEPGDTVIVPLDTEYKDNLTLWTQVTSIIYNTAVAFATVSNI
nr:SLBB domain-containing protein [Shewanella waksmanii]